MAGITYSWCVHCNHVVAVPEPRPEATPCLRCGRRIMLDDLAPAPLPTTITCPFCGHTFPLPPVPPQVTDYPRQSARCPQCGDGWLADRLTTVDTKKEQR